MTTACGPQYEFEGTLTFASVAATTVADQTVTLPSGGFPKWGTAGDGSPLVLELPNLDAGLIFCNVEATAQKTFKVRFYNTTASPITPTGTNAKLVQL